MKAKRIILSVIALCCTLVAGAEENQVPTAILQHGTTMRLFKGYSAFKNAVEAAEEGDVITLSQGVFEGDFQITKSVSIYGAGFEDHPEEGMEITEIKSSLYFGALDENTTLSKIHLEGIYISNLYFGQLKNGSVNRPVSELFVSKCRVKGDFVFKSDINTVNISCCVLNAVKGYPETIVIAKMDILNCYLSSTVYSLDPQSNVLIDHCIIGGYYDRNYLYAQFRFTNDIFISSASYSNSNSWITHNGAGSYLDHCLYNLKRVGGYYGIEMHWDYGNIYDCVEVPYTEVFADASNGEYSPERTFELSKPNEWIGTDNTQIGILGGDGFNKVPATPAVKSLELGVSGTTLTVTYDAEVR